MIRERQVAGAKLSFGLQGERFGISVKERFVMKTKLFGFATTVLLALSAFAQTPKYEVSVNYSYLQYNPAKSLTGSESLNGGGGAFVYNVRKYVGFKSEFTGYANIEQTFHVTAVPGTVPRTGTFTTQANLFTYLFGPQINIPAKKVRIFGQALFGGAHTNGYVNLFRAAGVTGLSASNNGFSMAFGGGVDLPVHKNVMFRPAQVDYLLTRFEWPALGINNQSNFRYQAGLVFYWGE
jgi:hypothetical protein